MWSWWTQMSDWAQHRSLSTVLVEQLGAPILEGAERSHQCRRGFLRGFRTAGNLHGEGKDPVPEFPTRRSLPLLRSALMMKFCYLDGWPCSGFSTCPLPQHKHILITKLMLITWLYLYPPCNPLPMYAFYFLGTFTKTEILPNCHFYSCFPLASCMYGLYYSICYALLLRAPHIYVAVKVNNYHRPMNR